MERISILCPFGDEKKLVEISQPFGGGDGYHVHVDHYYYGIILRRDNQWIGYFHESTGFTGADVDIILEIIREKRSAAH